MGRSFDRGGQNRKERERGKRRNSRQSERDREARDTVMQAKRTAALTALDSNKRLSSGAAASVAVLPAILPKIPTATIEQKRPGFLAQIIGRLFRKSA
jgi:hypothetical protein